MELTILIPCLNEAETLGICIDKAKRFLEANHIDGEILIADNGSTDGSIEIAEHSGGEVRVCHVSERGYGNALRGGCLAAEGKYVIMGDADDSYDFLNLMPFVEKLREGYDLVMGNRFSGGIKDGAMSWSHRYIGNPLLSFAGRLFYHSQISDFHCGLRGYNCESIRKLNLHTSGMEYASEMVIMSELSGLKITEVPTILSKDGRSGKSHLRSFRDGWRHLKFLLMYAPNWLFLYPGFALLIIGGAGSLLLLGGQLRFFDITFSVHTLLYCMLSIVIGVNTIEMFLIIKLYAYNHHFLLQKKSANWNKLSEDAFIFVGMVLSIVGIILSIYAVAYWKHTGFSELIPEVMMRVTIPAACLTIIGIQTVFTGFLMAILKIGKVGQ